MTDRPRPVVGILSDSHDNLRRLALAVEELRRRGISTVIHCGDICSPAVVEALAEHPDLEVHWVTGNCDHARGDLARAIRNAGHADHGERGEIAVTGFRLGFTHGHVRAHLREMVGDGSYDLVFHGHTHQRRETVVDGTRVVCPGALHRANPPGFAVLWSSGEIEMIDLPR